MNAVARTPQRQSPEQRQRVAELVEAAQARKAADEAYRRAMLAAYDDGVTVAAIAEAVGVRHETARLYLQRHQQEN